MQCSGLRLFVSINDLVVCLWTQRVSSENAILLSPERSAVGKSVRYLLVS